MPNRVLKRRAVNQSQGVTSDQIIEYPSNRSRRNRFRPVRHAGVYDAQTQKNHALITNHLDRSANTIADIHTQRWQVESFFK